jgi:plastocyanin
MARLWISISSSQRGLAGLLIAVSVLSGCGATLGVIQGRLVLPDTRTAEKHYADAPSGHTAAGAFGDACDAVISVRAVEAKAKRKFDPKPNPAPTSGSRTASNAAVENESAARRAMIMRSSDRFEPHVLAVKVGTTVDFENLDQVYHQAFSISPAKRFDLGSQAPGEIRSVTFDSVGVVSVYCELHPATAGFIVVLPDDRFTQPDAQGDFVVPGLPNGTYTVEAWHPSYGEVKRRVRVPKSGSLMLRLAF